ncbi:MAG: hypothetical protein R3B84_12990 [Zavarzinella sp.]
MLNAKLLIFIGLIFGISASCSPEQGNQSDLIPVEQVWPKSVEPMLPTYCSSVEPIPKDDSRDIGPYRDHKVSVDLFTSASGFGPERMIVFKDERKPFTRIELVGILKTKIPAVYVLDQQPSLKSIRSAKRRPLDEFEQRSLVAIRTGHDLVWTRESPKRMFGAIRAEANCLKCHTTAKEGDLLGAFTYYLNIPVDQLSTRNLTRD